MKLVRYGPNGREKPGLIAADGTLRDLSTHVADIGWDELSAAGRKRLRALDPAALPAVRGKPRYGVPFTGISKIVGIGLNYRAHAPRSEDAHPRRAGDVHEGHHLHLRPR
jgi:2,4-diketo-3-deoxy-L-fuconate hydrolase